MDELNLNLQEVDSLEAIVIVDNELDPMSPPAPDTVQIVGNLGQIALRSDNDLTDRGGASKEMRMEDICCSAHGLSILVVRLNNPPDSLRTRNHPTDIIQTATKGDQQHSVLFDVGPEEDVWERNVNRLRPNLSSIEVIQLSHWHRDHSGWLFVHMLQQFSTTWPLD